jgi:hypothetical protein
MKRCLITRALISGLFIVCAATLSNAEPLSVGYLAFDDTGLGYPSFSIVNLTGDIACDPSTGFLCDPGAFEDGLLRITRNGMVETFLLAGPLEPQDSTSVEDSSWPLQNFESARFSALLVPRSGAAFTAYEIFATLIQAAGQSGLQIGDLALIRPKAEIPEPGTAWLVLSASIAFALGRKHWLSRRSRETP